MRASARAYVFTYAVARTNAHRRCCAGAKNALAHARVCQVCDLSSSHQPQNQATRGGHYLSRQQQAAIWRGGKHVASCRADFKCDTLSLDIDEPDDLVDRLRAAAHVRKQSAQYQRTYQEHCTPPHG